MLIGAIVGFVIGFVLETGRGPAGKGGTNFGSRVLAGIFGAVIFGALATML